MMISKIEKGMLYCPKCQRTYEEGSQRFCSDEPVRLLPVPSSERADRRTNGVFSRITSQKSRDKGAEFSSLSKFSQTESRIFARPNFYPPPDVIFESKPEFESELELEPPKTKFESTAAEPPEQLLESDEIVIRPESAENEPSTSSQTNSRVETLPAAEDFYAQKPALPEVDAPFVAAKEAQDLACEKRLTRTADKTDPRCNLFLIFGIAVLLAALLAVSYFFISRPAQTLVRKPVETNIKTAATPEVIEPLPLPRPLRHSSKTPTPL